MPSKDPLNPVAAAYNLKVTRQKLATLTPEMQREVRKVQRFNAGAIISYARQRHTVHHQPQRPTMLRRLRII